MTCPPSQPQQQTYPDGSTIDATATCPPDNGGSSSDNNPHHLTTAITQAIAEVATMTTLLQDHKI
ncbi:MAG: hypothetical protein M3P08_00215 [Thermoproteota archaeon]|nr:hypothetical protein [Thermoproteota archaeon]